MKKSTESAAKRAPRGPAKANAAIDAGQPGVDQAAPRQWRNRIVGQGEEDAKALLANPKNWRTHPKAQQKALEGVLKEIGWVQQVVVNRVTGFVLDGHARVAMAVTRGEKVPVVYVELTAEEEALVLATLDPLSAMAGTDSGLLDELKLGMTDAYQNLVANMTTLPASGGGGGGGGAGADEGLEFKVVVDCATEQDQAAMLDRFKGEGLHCRALIS